MTNINTARHNKYIFILFVVILTTSTLFMPHAAHAAQLPNCGKIIPWAAAAYERDKNVRSDSYWGGTYKGYKYDGKYLLSGFIDEYFKPTFGLTFNQWSNKDVKNFLVLAKTCYQSAKKASWAAHRKRKYKLAGLFRGATGFIGMLGVMTPPNRIDSQASIMAYQKKLYAEFSKARSIKNNQIKKAKKMQATKANIQKLAVMARNPQFVYLRSREKKNHEITLKNYGIKLADKIVGDAIKKFNSFPATLDGLKRLQAYYKKLTNDLRGLKSSKWVTFNQAYKGRLLALAGKAADDAIASLKKFPATLAGLKQMAAFLQKMQGSLGQVRGTGWYKFEKAYGLALNNIAIKALDGYKKEISALPATVAGLKQLQTSGGNLFRFRPAPSNLKEYQDAAKDRIKEMKQGIRKIACYKELDSVGLDKKARDVALLGYNGETTLGLFVCAISKHGYKFQDYKSAGWLGSTYTLGILNRRGITLTIEMKKVEAVKGREMLVGVKVKDATSETEMTLTGWQDYALKLSGKNG